MKSNNLHKNPQSIDHVQIIFAERENKKTVMRSINFPNLPFANNVECLAFYAYSKAHLYFHRKTFASKSMTLCTRFIYSNRYYKLDAFDEGCQTNKTAGRSACSRFRDSWHVKTGSRFYTCVDVGAKAINRRICRMSSGA